MLLNIFVGNLCYPTLHFKKSKILLYKVPVGYKFYIYVVTLKEDSVLERQCMGQGGITIDRRIHNGELIMIRRNHLKKKV